MDGKSHGNSRDVGVDFPLLEEFDPVDNRDDINCQYVGAGCSTKQGVVHVNVNDHSPPLNVMAREQSDAYVVGVIFSRISA